MSAEWAAQDGGFCDGLICIRPLAQLLGPRPAALAPEEAGDEIIEVSGYRHAEKRSALYAGLYPLDTFSAETQAAAFLRPNAHATPVLLGEHGLTAWRRSRHKGLTGYLTFLEQTWGHVGIRIASFHDDSGERMLFSTWILNGPATDPFTPPAPA